MTHRNRARPAQIAWIDAVREPRQALGWSLDDWQNVIKVGRRLRLLSRLAHGLEAAGLLSEVPEAPRLHLVSELRVSHYRTAAMLWALDRVMAALGEPDHPCVLLKGAAYVGQRLPIASGRLPSDVDVMVPREQLLAVQARLQADGWKEVTLDEHDQRYYREWSHEVPPMRHPIHPIELDLHHNVLPPVARTTVDASKLFARVQPSVLPGWTVLHPVDQVLHSAAHLFLDSEARDRVRDLVDLDGLLRHFGVEPSFWDALADRADDLGLVEPLGLACRFCVDWFATPIPEEARHRLLAGASSSRYRWWLVPVLRVLLTPADPSRGAPLTQQAAAMAFLARYHFNRLPMRLLLPHLWHKMQRSRDDVTVLSR